MFRELGNLICFCMQLELALAQEEIVDLLQAAPFTNVIPKPFVKGNNVKTYKCYNLNISDTPDQEKKMRKMEETMKNMEYKYSRIQISAIVEGFAKQIESNDVCIIE